jgi:hypothetical protein
MKLRSEVDNFYLSPSVLTAAWVLDSARRYLLHTYAVAGAAVNREQAATDLLLELADDLYYGGCE